MLTVVHISDGVLNPSGVRFGSAEIYTVLERFRDEVDDTLCVGQRRPEDKDERVLLFVKMRPGFKFNDDLVNRIKTAIRTSLSSRHVPAYVFEIEDIPVSTPHGCRAIVVLIPAHRIVYRKQQEDRDRREADRVWLHPQA